MAVTWKKLAFADDVFPTSQIEVAELNTATYDDVQDWMNNTQSSGYFYGGIITDAGSGQINVAAGSGFIRATNDGIVEVKSFDWAVSNGITLTDHLTNYVYVDYNAGSPIVGVETTKAANSRSKFYLGKVFREGTDLHILQGGLNVTEVLKRIQGRINAVNGEIQHASGMALSETGTRNIAVSAGVFFAGFTQDSTTAVDTSGADTFEYYSYIAGAWTESDESQIDNLQYNDVSTPGSEALATLGNNNFGVHWVYMDIGGDVLVVYGQDSYLKLSDAEAASPPSISYGHIADMAILIGRIIIEKSAASFTAVESAFDVNFSPAIVTDHGDLAGLADDDHIQYLLVAGSRAMTGDLDMDTHQINNVVDPTLDQDAATKKYVDDQIEAALKKAAVMGTL